MSAGSAQRYVGRRSHRSHRSRRSRRSHRLGVVSLAVLALVAVGCGTKSDDDDGAAAPGGGSFTPPDIKEYAGPVGEGEGALTVLAWPGYAESGKNDKNFDWVNPFEEKTGCQVKVKEFPTSDEAVKLMQTGGYDVVSASGDATLRLIAASLVQPVNTDLVPNYAQESEFLKDQKFNSVNGQMYGIPHGWGANLLMYNTKDVTPEPTSWDVVFDKSGDYAGKVTAYDSPIYIADAAMYLMSSQPDLGIKNPYALDKDQLAAAVDLLKEQNSNISEYWASYDTEVNSFKSGASVVGTTWQYNAFAAKDAGAPVATTYPKEGVTGWSDTWMVSAKTDHINCSYLWLDWMASADVQAQVAQWFGEAPANPEACAIAAKGFCDQYQATDSDFASKIWYWTTPITQCLDGRTDVECTDYQDWTDAWTEIKG